MAKQRKLKTGIGGSRELLTWALQGLEQEISTTRQRLQELESQARTLRASARGVIAAGCCERGASGRGRTHGPQEAQTQRRCPQADCRCAEASLGQGSGRQELVPPQSCADCAASSIVPAWMRAIASTSGAYPPAMVTATGTRSVPSTCQTRSHLAAATPPRSGASTQSIAFIKDPHTAT